MDERERMPVHEQWTCGHIATAMCAECHQELVQRANELAAENDELRTKLAIQYGMKGGDLAKATQATIDQLTAENERLRERIRRLEQMVHG